VQDLREEEMTQKELECDRLLDEMRELDRIDKLKAENDKLREALEEIANHHWSSDHSKWLAKRALEG